MEGGAINIGGAIKGRGGVLGTLNPLLSRLLLSLRLIKY
jgi:hypothetical protein